MHNTANQEGFVKVPRCVRDLPNFLLNSANELNEWQPGAEALPAPEGLT